MNTAQPPRYLRQVFMGSGLVAVPTPRNDRNAEMINVWL
jgi:hypothetical protein